MNAWCTRIILKYKDYKAFIAFDGKGKDTLPFEKWEEYYLKNVDEMFYR